MRDFIRPAWPVPENSREDRAMRIRAKVHRACLMSGTISISGTVKNTRKSIHRYARWTSQIGPMRFRMNLHPRTITHVGWDTARAAK